MNVVFLYCAYSKSYNVSVNITRPEVTKGENLNVYIAVETKDRTKMITDGDSAFSHLFQRNDNIKSGKV